MDDVVVVVVLCKPLYKKINNIVIEILLIPFYYPGFWFSGGGTRLSILEGPKIGAQRTSCSKIWGLRELIFSPNLQLLEWKFNQILGLKGRWTSISSIFLYLVLYREFKIKPIPKISADSVKAFSVYEVFREQHHLQSAPQTTVLCIYWSRLWKVENARNIHISSKVSQSRM